MIVRALVLLDLSTAALVLPIVVCEIARGRKRWFATLERMGAPRSWILGLFTGQISAAAAIGALIGSGLGVIATDWLTGVLVAQHNWPLGWAVRPQPRAIITTVAYVEGIATGSALVFGHRSMCGVSRSESRSPLFPSRRAAALALLGLPAALVPLVTPGVRENYQIGTAIQALGWMGLMSCVAPPAACGLLRVIGTMLARARVPTALVIRRSSARLLNTGTASSPLAILCGASMIFAVLAQSSSLDSPTPETAAVARAQLLAVATLITGSCLIALTGIAVSEARRAGRRAQELMPLVRMGASPGMVARIIALEALATVGVVVACVSTTVLLAASNIDRVRILSGHGPAPAVPIDLLIAIFGVVGVTLLATSFTAGLVTTSKGCATPRSA